MAEKGEEMKLCWMFWKSWASMYETERIENNDA